MSFVYPNAVTVVLHEGGRVRLHPQQQWHDDDPFVKARPEFFTDTPLSPARSAGYQPVERATRAPGERRATRRGKKPADEKAGDSAEQSSEQGADE